MKTAAFPTSDILYNQLSELVREVERLRMRVDEEVQRTTHQSEPNSILLAKECATLLRDFQRYSHAVSSLKDSIEKKLNELQEKPTLKFDEPVLAAKFQTVMVLHMVGELGMNKRLEELRAIEARKREMRVQYEQSWSAIKAHFDETVQRLNLLLYMKECLLRDGVLPGNIHYSSQFPHIVQSPFGMRDMMTKIREAAALKPVAAPIESPKPMDQETFMQELAKKRELLMQLRAQAREEAKAKRN